MIYLKLFRESYLFALQSIITNKIRTFLTLLGITIGIFAVISVFTVFDSLERQIRSSIEELGQKVLFIQKWPWAMGHSDYPWWKYMNRPQPAIDELETILAQSQTVANASYMTGINRTAEKGSVALNNSVILGVSFEYDRVMAFDIVRGRYFTQNEMQGGASVGLIGSKVKETLFGDMEATGKTIKVGGRKLRVIGVLKEEGDDAFGESHDWRVVVPVYFLKQIADLENVNTNIVVKAKENVSIDEMRDEIKGIMRSARSLRPGAEDNFAINETSLLTQGFDAFFGIVSMIGWIIGGFSLLVGGFGIANIMFVSVKERTNQIGIQKSLGAKNYFILLQFLFEAIFLSLIGGLLGLLIVLAGVLIVNNLDIGFTLQLTAGNILLAISVSGIIGLVAGLVPSWQASRLNPVEAIRSA
ncbi:MAG: ABC transporter permease [Bacteroidota bacterium]